MSDTKDGTEAERQRVEARLQESEARFRIMADAAPVMLWMSREDGMCTFFNQTWLDFTGRTQEQEWGVGWAESVHFEDLQRCLDTYVDAFNARQVFEMEYRLRRADGEYRWVLDRGTPRYEPNGAFAGYIGSCTDVTDKKRTEVELRSALQAKRELFGTASHELKSPVAALRLQIERLKREGTTLPDAQRDILERMSASNDRLVQLVESILELSRAQDGRVEVTLQPIELGALVAALVEASRPAAMRKGLDLRYRPASTPSRLITDPSLLRTIVSHVLSNAIKFTDEGSIEVAIEVRGDEHAITVRDTGRGVAPADQARIFEPFQHLEAARNKHVPGVGVGLALSRQLAGLLGGRIAVESEERRGSTFTLTIPDRTPSREARRAS